MLNTYDNFTLNSIFWPEVSGRNIELRVKSAFNVFVVLSVTVNFPNLIRSRKQIIFRKVINSSLDEIERVTCRYYNILKLSKL